MVILVVTKHTHKNVLHTFALSSSNAPCGRIWKKQRWEMNLSTIERLQV